MNKAQEQVMKEAIDRAYGYKIDTEDPVEPTANIWFRHRSKVCSIDAAGVTIVHALACGALGEETAAAIVDALNKSNGVDISPADANPFGNGMVQPVAAIVMILTACGIGFILGAIKWAL